MPGQSWADEFKISKPTTPTVSSGGSWADEFTRQADTISLSLPFDPEEFKRKWFKGVDVPTEEDVKKTLPKRLPDFVPSEIPSENLPVPRQTNAIVGAGIRAIPSIAGTVGGGLLGGPPGAIAGGALGAGLGETLGEWYEDKGFYPSVIATETALGALPVKGQAIKQGLKIAGMGGVSQGVRNYAEERPVLENVPTAMATSFGIGAGGQAIANKLFKPGQIAAQPTQGNPPGITTPTQGITPSVNTSINNAVNTGVASVTPAPITPPAPRPRAKYPKQMNLGLEAGTVQKGGPPIVQVKAPSKTSAQPKFAKEPNPLFNAREFIKRFHAKRGSSDLAGGIVQDKFRKYDAEGFEAFKNIEQGKPGYEDVRAYLDNAYKQAKQIWKDIGYRENYLPLLFKEDKKKVQEVFKEIRAERAAQRKAAEAAGKRVSPKPGFTLERVLEDYEAAAKRGLTPRYKTVSELLGWYEQALVKGTEDKALIDTLRREGYIKPKQRPGFVALDANLVPQGRTKQGKTITWYATPEVKGWLENALNPPNSGVQGKVSRPFRWAKNMALSGGWPWSGLNWHGIANMPWRTISYYGVKSPLKAVKEFGNVLKYDFHPESARKILRVEKTGILNAQRHGLQLGVEGFWAHQKRQERTSLALSGIKKTIAEKGKLRGTGTIVAEGLERFEDALARVTFSEIIPVIKYTAWKDTVADMVKKGYNEEDAMWRAADLVNKHFGGLNDPTMDPTWKMLGHMFILAPDWFATKYQIAKGFAKGVRNPTSYEGQRYLNTVAGMMASLAIFNLMREAQGIPLENARRLGNVPIPALDEPGKSAEADPAGAAFEPIELTIRMMYELYQGEIPMEEIERFVRSNTSKLGQSAWTFAKGEDIYGRPVTNIDKYGNVIPTKEWMANAFGEYILGNTTPQSFQGPYNVLSGRSGLTQGAAVALEAPIRWYTRRNRFNEIEQDLKKSIPQFENPYKE